jgi:hypothetical protein
MVNEKAQVSDFSDAPRQSALTEIVVANCNRRLPQSVSFLLYRQSEGVGHALSSF